MKKSAPNDVVGARHLIYPRCAILRATAYVASDQVLVTRRDHSIPESHLADFQSRIGKEFSDEQQMADLTALRDRL